MQALADVDFEIVPGEVHALLGENGAGKSTLVGILGGFVVPDSGLVRFQGEPWPLGDPRAVLSRGLAMVHQHFTLVPEFSVAENLALSQMSGLMGLLDTKALAAKALIWAEEFGWEIDPSARTRNLPVGIQQRLEILKALAHDPQILILDEPTAVLTPEEVVELFGVLRKLRDQGKTVILIAHKLSEVLAVADRVTVLRRGRWVATAPIAEAPPDQLIAWMLGEQGLTAVPVSRTSRQATPYLNVREIEACGDRGERAIDGISFQAARGEIVGFGGVDGNGQVELAECLAGVRPLRFGSIELPPGAKLAYIPQDRQGDGLALGLSIADNLLIEGHRQQPLRFGPFLRPGKVRAWCERLVEKFGIKIGRLSDPLSSLSGGNQQKVVVSRTLNGQPDILVAVNPTRGLDVGASEFVRGQIREAANGGCAVVLISTDSDELAEMADRTYFLSRGRIVDQSLANALLGASRSETNRPKH